MSSTAITVGPSNDMTGNDLRRLVEIVAAENSRLGFYDKQVQHIETALDTALIEVERA